MLTINKYSNRSNNFRQKSEGPAFPADEQRGGQPDEDVEDLGAGAAGQLRHGSLRQELRSSIRGGRVSSYHCSVQCGAATRTKTSLEADKDDNNHEEKLKTHKEKKFVSADQPSQTNRSQGPREIPHRLIVTKFNIILSDNM